MKSETIGKLLINAKKHDKFVSLTPAYNTLKNIIINPHEDYRFLSETELLIKDEKLIDLNYIVDALIIPPL